MQATFVCILEAARVFDVHLQDCGSGVVLPYFYCWMLTDLVVTMGHYHQLACVKATIEPQHCAMAFCTSLDAHIGLLARKQIICHPTASQLFVIAIILWVKASALRTGQMMLHVCCCVSKAYIRQYFSQRPCRQHKTRLRSCSPAADEEVIQKLPCFPTPPKSFSECDVKGIYEILSCSAEERAAGQYHDACVLHVPSKGMQPAFLLC